MKKRTYQPKRTTFISLLVRAFCVVLALSLVFAYLCDMYIRQTIHQQASEQISEQTSHIQRHINEIQEETDPRYHMQEISAEMSFYLYYDIMIDDPLSFSPNENFVQIIPEYFPSCYTAAMLIGEDNSVAASNRQRLWTHIRFSDDDDPDSGWYVCDDEMLQMTEVDQLYADYRELEQKSGLIDIRLTSAYVDRENHTFIPHEGAIEYYLYPNEDHNSPLVLVDETEINLRVISIDVEKEGYELMEIHQGANSQYPRSVMLHFVGADKEKIERFDAIYQAKDQYPSGGYQMDKGGDVYSRNVPIYVDGKPYYLEICFVVDHNVPQVRRLFWKWTILFTALLTLLALLWCWQKNVMNKAKYAFEDYQCDLTDHLAHDIKTPLMAISGYAENIQNGDLSDAEQQQYLSAILDNVAFTDSLISRTLFLNHIGEKSALKREDIRLEVMADDIMRKYRLLLDEKNIAYSISGNAELNADRASLETILENLVSNAVKYTPDNGEITVTLDKKCLMIANTVAQKINTKDLKRPFVRGDEARSNVKGNGLGLSIAERAAHLNGFTLSLSCTDEIFKAELRL